MRIQILAGALILGTAAGAGAQATGPTVPATEAPASFRSPGASPVVEGGARLAVDAAAARVAEQVGVESPSPDRLGRWLMATGATLVVAGLADWVGSERAGALRDRDFAAYGAGLVLFGTGAMRAASPPSVPAASGAGVGVGEPRE
jgi:hypothetical protein